MISNDTRSFYGHGISFPLFSRSSVTFQGHTSRKIDDFLDLDPIWARLLGRWQLSYLSDLHCLLLMIQHTFFLRPCRSLNQYIVWQDLGKHRDTTNIDNVHICLTHIIATHRSDWAAVWGSTSNELSMLPFCFASFWSYQPSLDSIYLFNWPNVSTALRLQHDCTS